MGGLLVVYLSVAYLFIPSWWRHHGQRSTTDDLPTITRTGDGAPGDPINVGLVGTRKEVTEAMLAAGWHPADDITLKTSWRICRASLLKQAYLTAPVSNLYLWGRKQDLAFEAPAGRDPSKRHHVRFWRAEERTEDDRPIWVGAATYDRSVGLSGRNFQFTHHIAADVDAERDQLIADLYRHEQLINDYRVAGVGPTQAGRNGGFDRYFTDGDRVVGVISTERDALALGTSP
jgi:hypothetical protein